RRLTPAATEKIYRTVVEGELLISGTMSTLRCSWVAAGVRRVYPASAPWVAPAHRCRNSTSVQPNPPAIKDEVIKMLKTQLIQRAEKALHEKPLTVTAYKATRSAGGLHDFYSEGDYWWPDPANVDSPYIQRDGMTNPDNFVEHRLA